MTKQELLDSFKTNSYVKKLLNIRNITPVDFTSDNSVKLYSQEYLSLINNETVTTKNIKIYVIDEGEPTEEAFYAMGHTKLSDKYIDLINNVYGVVLYEDDEKIIVEGYVLNQDSTTYTKKRWIGVEINNNLDIKEVV